MMEEGKIKYWWKRKRPGYQNYAKHIITLYIRYYTLLRGSKEGSAIILESLSSKAHIPSLSVCI